MKKILISVLVLLCSAGFVYAEDIAVVFTGNTYASLYDCGHCPSNVGGAVTRRATALKKIKNENTSVLLVDAGNFTAGGILDEFHSRRSLDKKRTEIYLRVMSDMGYDAVCLGDEDFNYGVSFLKKNRARYKLDFLSANEGKKIARPYIVKKAGSRRIAFIGLTSDLVSQRQGRSSAGCQKVLSGLIPSLKKKADIIILLSNMGDKVNREISDKFPEIDVIISSGNMHSMIPYEKTGKTILCRPSYQGKDLRILRLSLDDSGLSSSSLEEVQISKDIEEDPEIKSYIPACFCDADCFSPDQGSMTCKDPGTGSAVCEAFSSGSFLAKIITDTACPSCATGYTEGFLKNRISGISFETMDFRDKQAEEYIDLYQLKTIPAFLVFPREEKEQDWADFSDFLDLKQGSGLVKPEYSGVCMFLDREIKKARIDVFADLSDPVFPSLARSLARIKEEEKIDIDLHFYAPAADTRQPGPSSFNPADEALRFSAVKLRYPDLFWQYTARRSSDLANSWWISLFDELGIDYKEIRSVLVSDKFNKFNQAERSLREELKINEGTALLVGNKYLFRIMNLEKQELLKLLDYVSSSD